MISLQQCYVVDIMTVIVILQVTVQLFVTPRTIQSMEFSRPEYWSR